MRKTAILAFVCLSLVCVLSAQDAVPGEILARTLLIKNNAVDKYGSAFLVEHKGMAYLVTARHMVEGLPVTKATIDVWQEKTWKPLQTVKTLFPKSDDVDIAVFKLNEKIPKPYDIAGDDTGGGYAFGQQVWFLGYPYQISTQFGAGTQVNFNVPFIKRGTMSAMDSRNPDAVVLYIDGFNNPGFSGGPVVYWDFSRHKYGIAGVVKGYKEDTAKVVINGQHVDTQLLVNSGILVAYSIKHATEAIETDDK
jgi:hypothetical protein